MAVGLVGMAGFLAAATAAGAATGDWERAWGKDVLSTGGDGFTEVCTSAADCKTGATGTGRGGEFDGPQAVAVDGSGNVYVAEASANRIQVFDSAGNFLRTWGRGVDSAGGSGSAEVCAVAADCQTGTAGGQGGEFNYPSGVDVDAAGNVYVVDQVNNRVQKFDANGNFLVAWGRDVLVESPSNVDNGWESCTVAAACKAGVAGDLGGELTGPQRVAVDGDGNVYVTEASFSPANHRIQVFNDGGDFLRALGKDVVVGGVTGSEVCTVAAACKAGVSGTLAGELSYPQGVAVDGSGDVHVAEGVNQRIQVFDVFDVNSTFVRMWGKDVVVGGGTGSEVCTVAAACKAGASGALGGEFASPAGVTVDGSGNVYVADSFNQRVQMFAASGEFSAAWGRDVVTGGVTGFEVCTAPSSCKAGVTGGLGGEFNGPSGVGADGVGNVYVSELSGARVQQFGDTTDPTATLVTPAEGAVYRRGAVVAADFGCDDDPTGFGIDTCVTTPSAVNTSTAGSRNFTVTATDLAGNTTQVTHGYTVVLARPDARIRRGTGALFGNNVYNTTGPRQTRRASVARGGRVTYWISMQNDAVFAERLRLRGAAGTPRFAVVYRSPGGANITSRVRTGIYTTPRLAPGATHNIRAIVTVRRTAPRGSSLARTVRATSTTDGRRSDAVRFITRRR